MLSHTRWFLVVSVVMLLILLAPGSAAADGGVSFLGDQELTVTLPDGQPDVTFPVKVINGSKVSQNIYLDLVGLTDEDGAPVPPGVLPDNLPGKEDNVASGKVRMFEFALTRVNGLPGSYTGQLVAYGDDGTLARLGFTLVVEEPAAEVPATAVLEPDFLEEVTLVGLKYWPSPLARFGPNVVTPITVRVGEASSEPEVVGSVSGSNGQVGQVVWEGATLEVKGITQAGEYTGKVDLLPDDEEGGETTLKVQVRDVFWWPLLVLVVSLLISTWLDAQAKVSRPRKRLEIGLKKLKEQATQLQKNIYRIYEVKSLAGGKKTESGLLATAASEALDAFDAAGSDEERKKWGLDGDEFKQIQGYVEELPKLYALSQAVSECYQSLQERVQQDIQDKELPPGFDVEKLPVAIGIKGALEPRLVKTADELEKLQGQLKTVSPFVTDLLGIYLRLVAVRDFAKQSGMTNYYDEAKRLIGRLLSDKLKNADYLVGIDASTKALELDLHAARVVPALDPSLRLFAWSSMMQPELSPAWPLRVGVPALPNVRGMLNLLHPVEAVSKTSRELEKELGRLDLAFNMISGFIVVVTGLSTLYLGKTNFGSLADYVGVLLWGTVVDEGFKLARRLAPGLMGLLGGR